MICSFHLWCCVCFCKVWEAGSLVQDNLLTLYLDPVKYLMILVLITGKILAFKQIVFEEDFTLCSTSVSVKVV